MHIPDDLLAAYVDGELEGAERVRVEQAIAHDAGVARRVSQQRALRARLRRSFETTLTQPVPQRLVRTARLATQGGSAQIIDLAQVRAERARRSERPRTLHSRRLAFAASLVVGVLIGLFIQPLVGGDALTEYSHGTLLARGALARVLDDELASARPSHAEVQVGLTFKSKVGGYCRSFTAGSTAAIAGLACRAQDQWQIVTLLQSPPNGTNNGGLRMAATTLPTPLLQAVNARIAGEPLDALTEAKARESHWR